MNKYNLTTKQQEIFENIMEDITEVQQGDIFAEHSFLSITGAAGCSTEGNNIEIELPKRLVKKDELMRELNISKRNLDFMIFHKIITKEKGSIYYDINSLDFSLFKIISENKQTNVGKILTKDNLYTSKYLRLKYWLGFNNVAESIRRVQECRKYAHYFEEKLIKELKHFNEKNKAKSILLIQKKILDGENLNLSTSIISKKFWLERGYSEEEAIMKTIEHKNTKNTKCE